MTCRCNEPAAIPFAVRVATCGLALALAACGVRREARMDAIDALMQRYAGDVPGAALLVVRDGAVVVRRTWGLADLEAGEPVRTDTNFRLASVSKQFTAAAILLLAQDGRLGLDDPVRRWLPSLPPITAPVTLRHLLTHASGLVDYEDLMGEDWPGQIRDAGVLALLEREDRLLFAPGTAYRYSNGGYALLALVVERASGEPFQTFVRRRIFEPLGMQGTHARVDGGPPIPHRAYGYSRIDGRWQRTDQSSTSAVLGDGGIHSSIDDLAKWDAALDDERLLDARWREAAFAPQQPVDGETDVEAYGFGWRVHGDLRWHSGETVGFRNVILRWPAHRLTVVLLGNRDDPEPYRTARAIARLYGAE